MNNGKYTLGSLPWEEKDLKKEYFHNFIKTRKAIKEHPGFLAHDALQVLRCSLDVFKDFTLDLFHAIDLFAAESQSQDFWFRSKREHFNKLELHIRKSVFSTAMSAMLLVDTARNIVKNFEPSGYHKYKNETFEGNEEHKFIQDLRNFNCHCRMIEPDWHISWTDTGKQMQFLLNPEKLLIWENWTSLSKEFIRKHPEGVDVECLFRNYEKKVKEFNHWFYNEIEKMSEPELSEYRKYERILNSFEAKSFWNLMFSQVIPGKVDPYDYLNKYLTVPELNEVFLLPKHSRQQVNRIIKILDEYKICDKELRKKIYEAFKVIKF